jgi:hypothetical protein
MGAAAVADLAKNFSWDRFACRTYVDLGIFLHGTFYIESLNYNSSIQNDIYMKVYDVIT